MSVPLCWRDISALVLLSACSGCCCVGVPSRSGVGVVLAFTVGCSNSSSSSLRRRDVCGRHGVICNICLGDDFHPSRCTNHMAGSAWDAFGTFEVHQRCGINGARAVATCASQIRTHGGHWFRQRTMETHFKCCDHQYVSSGCVRRSAFPSPGVCSEAKTRGILSGKWQLCLAWLAVPIRLVLR